jgi:riboflavin biosynthesis pyrimidine reductase
MSERGALAPGTATVLADDPEGSTRLGQEHPDAMKAALARPVAARQNTRSERSPNHLGGELNQARMRALGPAL